MGRPRGKPVNHHLKLKNGVWIFRWTRNGRDIERSTACPKAEIAAARKIRDKLIAGKAEQRFGVDELPPAGTLDAIVKLYLEAESQPYDRERGGAQPGHKRSSGGDRRIVDALKKHLDFALPADRIDPERLLDAAASMPDLAPLTIRNRFRLLRRVFAWARANKRKTGVVASPFDEVIEKSDRKRLFPGGVAHKAPPYTRDQLRALYQALPSHIYFPVRFAAHTGMRIGELLNMTWGRVDLDRRVYTTDPRWTKMNKERAVPLGEVAAGILEKIRPENPDADAPVWINSRDLPLRDLDSVLKRAMKKDAMKALFPAPRPGWRLPDRHSLRRTCASAVAQVAHGAVVSAILGHSPASVTDLYVTIPLEDQLAALNRAALLIDGEPQENVVPLVAPTKTGRKTGRVAQAVRAR